MNEAYQKCAAKMKEIAVLRQASDVLEWDEHVMMPPRSGGARSAQRAAIAGVIHEKYMSPGLVDSLRDLSSQGNSLSDDERICVREWLRDCEKETKIPLEIVSETARVISLASGAWAKAEEKSDFSVFAPFLKQVVELKRRKAEAIGCDGSPYDALLDDFEPKMTVARLDPVIKDIRKSLVPIVASIRGASTDAEVKAFSKRYPEDEQESLIRELIPMLGVDMSASRLDRGAHPVTYDTVCTDVRITNRYGERSFPESINAGIHEAGHAIYGQGQDERHIGTPLGQHASMGIHESQSRLFENHIGRSRAFVSFLLPRLKKRFARQLKGMGEEAFYRAINRVKISPIRIAADEVTYSLHVIVRYEIEKQLISGEIEVKDLPRIWNDRMEEYLGIRPKDDAEGVLQDIHWSMGYIGYFPTYLLGTLYAAQLWSKIEKTMPGVNGKIAKGEFAPIVKWLRENIHRQGRRYPPAELIERATGESFKAGHFINYLKKKYGEIYKMKL